LNSASAAALLLHPHTRRMRQFLKYPMGTDFHRFLPATPPSGRLSAFRTIEPIAVREKPDIISEGFVCPL
jgi:hypothetical protein